MAKQDTCLDIKGLCDEFGMDDATPMMDLDIEPTDKTPEEVMRENITRANKILDIIMLNMSQGNITARLIEVASQVINSVTATSKEIMSNNNYSKYIKIKDKLKDLKEREVVVKEQTAARMGQKKIQGGKTVNQNIIVSSREDLLKLMGKPEEIENAEIIEYAD